MLGVSVLFALLCLQRSRRIGRLAGTLLLCGFIVWAALLWIQPAFIDG
ncbi:Inner membrane protein YrbG|nr:Inner membrane protein YrbG [Candidatus Pantoea persica]